MSQTTIQHSDDSRYPMDLVETQNGNLILCSHYDQEMRRWIIVSLQPHRTVQRFVVHYMDEEKHCYNGIYCNTLPYAIKEYHQRIKKCSSSAN